jgi:hypothetical protein
MSDDTRLELFTAQEAELERFAYEHALQRLPWAYIADKANRAPEHGGLGRRGMRSADVRRAAGRMAARILDKAARYEDRTVTELRRLRAERDAAFDAFGVSADVADWGRFREADAAIAKYQQIFFSALDPETMRDAAR